jgi:hypothetical protein
MILEHKKIIIFSYPRCATKLLASILEGFEYHNYGEWYDVWTSRIDKNTAVRLSAEEIKKIKEKGIDNLDKLNTDQATQLVNLNNLWKATHNKLNPISWTLTLWPSNLNNFPFVLETYRDCHWLCPTRDRWSQMLSWFISFYNNNFNGYIQSRPITISKTLFDRHYWQLRRTEINQNWILNNFSSTPVPFDELTTGRFKGFGADYPVNSKDEHELLEPLVVNLNEVKDWFYHAENQE